MARNQVFWQVFKNLSWTDRLLPLLILVFIIIGVLLSVYVPSSRAALEQSQVVNVSAPIAVGLIVMMVPPLCKIRWESLHTILRKRSLVNHIYFSLFINWILCPFLMFGLAWLTLFDQDEYREGIIMIGLARCIAMVLIWNRIAGGDEDLCAVLVIVNSVLQMILYAPYQIFFCYVITGESRQGIGGANVSYSLVARSIGFFLGVPMGIGLCIRLAGIRLLGRQRFNDRFMPLFGHLALIGLLYTVTVIFIAGGDDLIHHIGSAFRCFVPLILYFIITWFSVFFAFRCLFGFKKLTRSQVDSHLEEQEKLCGCEPMKDLYKDRWHSYCTAEYQSTVTQTFTAASNNFELSIAIAIALYGNGSKQAIASTFGPLLEVPILLLLTFVARYFRVKFLWRDVYDEDLPLRTQSLEEAPQV